MTNEVTTKWEELSVSEQVVIANLIEPVKNTCSACDALERKGLSNSIGNTEAGFKLLEDAERRGFVKRVFKDNKTFLIRVKAER